MSPERRLRKIPEVSRTSHGYAKGERKRLGEARKIDPQTERIMRFAVPSRETVLGMLDLRTRNNPEAHRLFENNILLLTEFIDARIAIANDKDWTKYNEFLRHANDNERPDYNPNLIDNLNPHFHIVLDCFPKKRK